MCLEQASWAALWEVCLVAEMAASLGVAVEAASQVAEGVAVEAAREAVEMAVSEAARSGSGKFEGFCQICHILSSIVHAQKLGS